ncbi:MAG: L,D-transpeptidase [Pyrinomonadaceae bacterium]|nr:L,D-transpeptidase [Pyrinomonadaceae bacterium]
MLSIGILSMVGCAPQNSSEVNSNINPSNNGNTDSNSTKQTNSNSQPKINSVRLSVTLPVLDAMLFDDEFVNSLKTEAGLNDAEIEKLRNASGEAVAQLGEDEKGSGSTRAAVKRAESKIIETVGNEKAEKLFQLINKKYSGELDPQTALSSKPNAIPSDTRIVVNAPAYRMDAFQDGKLIKTYKIGIGYPEFPLPEGLRKADTIIFNPTWTPPDEPWVKGKYKPYRKVAAGSKSNPLGFIKIPIGLPSLIHGGKQAARLGNFASHGCVGLTNEQVQDFSLILSQISGTTLTEDEIAGYQKNREETKNLELAKTIPVELRYETIVVENGKLRIYRDVYEHGTNTEDNLKKVLENYGVKFESLSEADRQNILNSLAAMNTDAEGKTVDENAANSNKSTDSNSDKTKNSEITSNIKGRKEIEISIAQLEGKGYPAPANYNSGQK